MMRVEAVVVSEPLYACLWLLGSAFDCRQLIQNTRDLQVLKPADALSDRDFIGIKPKILRLHGHFTAMLLRLAEALR
jgi:hypothetical protein